MVPPFTTELLHPLLHPPPESNTGATSLWRHQRRVANAYNTTRPDPNGATRSSFAERFARVVGKTPLNYLLQWRLAVARDLLTREQKSVAETALAVGYESASGFSTAFSREMGKSPRDSSGLIVAPRELPCAIKS